MKDVTIDCSSIQVDDMQLDATDIHSTTGKFVNDSADINSTNGKYATD